MALEPLGLVSFVYKSFYKQNILVFSNLFYQKAINVNKKDIKKGAN